MDLPVRQLIDRFIAPSIDRKESVTAVAGFFAGRDGTNRELRLADGRILALTHQPMPQGSVITAADVTAEHEAKEKIQRMARFDRSRACPTARVFRKGSPPLWPRARKARLSASLSIDLDRFKEVNDSHGHQVGDLLLAMVGERLLAVAEASFVARIGGDEFAALAPTADRGRIGEIGAAMVRALSQPFEIEARIVRIGASVGVAVYRTTAEDGAAESLIKAADHGALWREGRRTRRHEIFRRGNGPFDPPAPAFGRRIARRRSRAAELSLAYQPIVDVADRSVMAVEALLRWTHPEFGAVVADANSCRSPKRTRPLSRLANSCCARPAATPWPGRILSKSRSISPPLQFERGDLVETVRTALADSGLPREKARNRSHQVDTDPQP